MNFITHKMAISLYPSATFQAECSLVMLDRRHPLSDIRNEYENLGFKMVSDVPSHLKRHPVFNIKYCRVGDRYTWCLPVAFDFR